MMKVVILMFFTMCASSSGLYAQEAVHQSLGTAAPASAQSVDDKQPMTPYPVLMPKAIAYPRKAVWRGWEGQSVVVAEVLPDGSVGRTALSKTSGHEVLDQAAQEGIKTWKFAAESEKGDAVPQYVDIPVTFKLQDKD